MAKAARVIVSVAAVAFAPYLAPSIFGTLAAGSLAAGLATAATAGGLNAIGQAATGGGGSFGQNFLGGAIGSGVSSVASGLFSAAPSAATAPGLDLSGAINSPVATSAAVNGGLAPIDASGAITSGGADVASAGLSGVNGGVAGGAPALDISNVGQASATPVTDAANISSAGVAGNGPTAGLNTTPQSIGANNPSAVMGNGAYSSTPGVTDTNSYSPMLANGPSRLGAALDLGVSKITDPDTYSKLLDKATEPSSLISLGSAAYSALGGGGDARQSVMDSNKDYQDATKQSNAFNMAQANKKSSVADEVVNKGYNLDPAYYAAQAGGAFGITRDRQWEDRLMQLQAQNASPDQIASEQRKYSFDTSLGKQTAYQDTYGRAQQNQISTLGTGAGLYTGMSAPTNGTASAVSAYGAKQGESPAAGFANTLEDIFGAQRAKNRATAGIKDGGAGNGASVIQ